MSMVSRVFSLVSAEAHVRDGLFPEGSELLVFLGSLRLGIVVVELAPGTDLWAGNSRGVGVSESFLFLILFRSEAGDWAVVHAKTGDADSHLRSQVDVVGAAFGPQHSQAHGVAWPTFTSILQHLVLTVDFTWVSVNKFVGRDPSRKTSAPGPRQMLGAPGEAAWMFIPAGALKGNRNGRVSPQFGAIGYTRVDW